MAEIKIAKAIFDIIWPVGSFYETSNEAFDPNIKWYGTWVEDTKGFVTVGRLKAEGDEDLWDRNDRLGLTLGKSHGEVVHKLSVDELASHAHQYDRHDFWFGEANIEGGVIGTTTAEGKRVMNTSQYTGGNKPHNNIQPSVAVIRWHRTA